MFHLIECLSRKRGICMNKFIKKNSQGPNINTIIVLLAVNHLWSHILISSTKSGSFSFHLRSGPSKITKFNIHFLIKENILWLNYKLKYFDISVKNVITMKIINSINCLYKKSEGLDLWESRILRLKIE